MSVWFEGKSELECSIGDVNQSLGELGAHQDQRRHRFPSGPRLVLQESKGRFTRVPTRWPLAPVSRPVQRA